MGIVLSTLFAFLIVSPISTVGIATAIFMEGVASGTADLGAVATGFTLLIIGWKANGFATSILHVLGSPKVQMANVFSRPITLLPILSSAAILGGIDGAVGISGTPISAGFGISGLIGPLAALNYEGWGLERWQRHHRRPRLCRRPHRSRLPLHFRLQHAPWQGEAGALQAGLRVELRHHAAARNAVTSDGARRRRLRRAATPHRPCHPERPPNAHHIRGKAGTTRDAPGVPRRGKHGKAVPLKCRGALGFLSRGVVRAGNGGAVRRKGGDPQGRGSDQTAKCEARRRAHRPSLTKSGQDAKT